MNNIKQINKQFYKYWKKESTEWRPVLLIVVRKFGVLNRLSNLTNKSIHKLVLSLLESKSYYISDKADVCELLKIELSDVEYKALLLIAGYYYHKPSKSYTINRERIRLVMNVCDAAECFAKGNERFRICEKINERRMNYYEKKKDKFERKYNKIALNERINAFQVEPANGERFQLFNFAMRKILLIVGIAAFVALVIYVASLNFGEKGKVDTTYLSFWNSLLGACIPGMCTIFTTFLLIKHEYKVDYHRERMLSLPVFSFFHVHDKNVYINEEGKWNDEKYAFELLNNTAENDILSDEEVDLYILCNKGGGMAFNVSHDRGDIEYIFGDISQNDECIIAMKKYTSLNYVISYMDIYGNKYTQRFEMDNSFGSYNIMTFPPELVLRTKLMRYQQ